MIITRKRKVLFFLPWALAAFLICTGSLINFHQYKIWHNPLLPQLVIHKKDLEKTPTDIVLEKIRFDKNLLDLHFVNDSYISEGIYSGVFSAQEYHYPPGSCMDEDPLAFLVSHGLRAPPLV